jgi:hypothetical protein
MQDIDDTCKPLINFVEEVFSEEEKIKMNEDYGINFNEIAGSKNVTCFKADFDAILDKTNT